MAKSAALLPCDPPTVLYLPPFAKARVSRLKYLSICHAADSVSTTRVSGFAREGVKERQLSKGGQSCVLLSHSLPKWAYCSPLGNYHKTTTKSNEATWTLLQVCSQKPHCKTNLLLLAWCWETN